MVLEREFKRIKLRAGVLGSPVQVTLSSSSASSTVVRRAAPFVPSHSETITQNKGLGLDGSIAVQRNVKLDTSSPVDRMLAQKLESINAATKELENAKMQKENGKAGNIESGALQRRFTFSLWQMPFKGWAYQTQL